MALESGTYISDFNTSNPVDNTDTLATLGAHARLTKSFVKATFPNVTGAVTVTHTQLNAVTAKAVAGLATASGLTIGTGKLLGRTTASTGAVEEIAIGSGLSMSSTTLSAAVGNHYVTVDTGNGMGSTNTKVRRWTTTVGSAGTAITYADSATNGGSFTINETGLYAISATDGTNISGTQNYGFSVNSSQLTTAIESITAANRLAMTRVETAGRSYGLACVARLTATDVVRLHAGSSLDAATASLSTFTIRKIGL